MTPRIVHNVITPEYYFRERCHITEWSNAPDDDRVSIARARVEPGVTTCWHRLHGVAERYVILAGSGVVEIGDLELEAIRLSRAGASRVLSRRWTGLFDTRRFFYQSRKHAIVMNKAGLYPS